MKKLKLDHSLAEQIRSGKKTSTLRLFDDKDLSVNDSVLLIDKVDSANPSSWKEIGTATINQVVERRLGDLTEEDLASQGIYANKQAVIADFQKLYGQNVTAQTPVKIIQFTFSPDIPPPRPTEIIQRAEEVIIYADGGSRGNPGPSASGFVIYDGQQNMLVYRGTYVGITTNNQAEYTALKLALEEAKSIGANVAKVYMDSLLVINQMRGIFKVKNRDLWPIHDAVQSLAKQFKTISFTQVPREMNKLADAAVNQALDAHLGQLDMSSASK